MTSYQHSLPGLNVDLASADENDSLFANPSVPRNHQIAKNKRLVGMLILGVCMLVAVMHAGNSAAPPTTASLLQSSDSSMPDYNDKEGQYDWQKCKASNDPDCWKKEGERVGHWWSNFGQRMSAWWKSLFGPKKPAADDEKVEDVKSKVKSADTKQVKEKVKAKSKEEGATPTVGAVEEKPKS